MTPEKVRITLVISSFTIHLNVDGKDEKIYREAAETINHSYDNYARKFPNMPIAELWAYVALTIAVNLHSDARDKNVAPYLTTIQALNQEIENMLSKSDGKEV